MSGPGGSFIQNRSDEQPNAKINLASGTISDLYSSTVTIRKGIRFPDGTFMVSSPTASSPMTPGASYYIQNRDTLQSGATFYVSSGTVDGEFNAVDIHSRGDFYIDNNEQKINFGATPTGYLSYKSYIDDISWSPTLDVNIRHIGSSPPQQNMNFNIGDEIDGSSGTSLQFGYRLNYTPGTSKSWFKAIKSFSIEVSTQSD
jgi:hypothetical protein